MPQTLQLALSRKSRSISKLARRRALVGAAALFIGIGSSAANAAELVVSAAASLTNAFTDIGKAFERVNPGEKVVFNFAASDVLLAQISKGAPADVFASADEIAMNKGVQENVIDKATRRDFVRNQLVLIAPSDSTVSITGLSSLSAPAIKRIAIGNPASVPVGRYTKGVLDKANMWTSLEPKLVNAASVRQALDYVARGETEAGFVYSTDAAIMKGKVKITAVVPTPTPILYPIAVVKGSKNAALAKSFLAFLASPAIQTVLSDYGFGKP